MSIAKDAAPEIDRLVWTVNRGVGPKHGARLGALANEVGLDSLFFFPVVADFLLAGAASVDLICRRMPYSPASGTVARFEDLATRGLVEERDGGVVATDRLIPLLRAVRAAQADIAADTWAGHEARMATVADLARKVALAASDAHVVAVTHRGMPASDDASLLLYDRLVTLRYVRQHDHVMAWQGQGLTAPMIVAMTNLWHGEKVAADDPVLADLVDRGLASRDPIALTASGLTVRGTIENETDERAQETFGVLDDREAMTLLSELRALPGSGT